MKDPGLFILPCRLGDSKPFDTLSDLGSRVNLLPFKVGLLEETDDVLGLADGIKSYPVGIVRNVEVHVGKLKLFEDFHVVDMERELTCLLLVGRGFLATANAVIDFKKAKIAIGEGLIRSIFGVKELDFGDDNVPYWTTIGKRKSYRTQTSKDGIGLKIDEDSRPETTSRILKRRLDSTWDTVLTLETASGSAVKIYDPRNPSLATASGKL
ncbi:MAK10-like protein [Tanacetum coccineum]